MSVNRFFGLLAIVFFSGCVQQEPLVEPNRYYNTPLGNFQAFWDGMSRRYAFWGYDPTDWDKTYGQFVNQVTDETTDAELAEIFGEMVKDLIDTHYGIEAVVDGEFVSIGPQKIIERLSKYHFLLDDDYFEKTLFNRLAANTRKKFNGFVYGVIDNKYQYVRIPEFRIFIDGSQNPEFFEDMLNFMANPAPQYKGLILDLRFNPGGVADEVTLVAGNFTDRELVVGSTRYKYGNNRNEFGPWIPQKIFPSSIGYNNLPVVILCDAFTISAAERVTMAMSLLPQVTVLGERTIGAHGALVQEEGRDVVYAGEFFLPNGWKVQAAVEVFRHADNNVYEGIGFPPDVVVPFDVNLFKTTGRDNQLEQALQKLPQ
ncbi:MAG: S41 family peptidase [Saprospiraceae bacterium]